MPSERDERRKAAHPHGVAQSSRGDLTHFDRRTTRLWVVLNAVASGRRMPFLWPPSDASLAIDEARSKCWSPPFAAAARRSA